LASDVCRSWKEFICVEKSLWLNHFKIIRKKRMQNSELERKDWRNFLNKFQEEANFDEIVALIEMFRTYESQFLNFSSGWLEDPLVAVCKFGTLKLFKAYSRLYNLDVNKRLVAEECGINTTVLHIAAAVDNIKVVEYILPKVEEKNSFNEVNETPLQFAINNGNLEMTRLIYQYVPQESDVWKQPLIYDAISAENIEVLKLIEPHLNFDQEDKDHDREHPLETAILLENLEIFKYVYCRAKSIDSLAIYLYSLAKSLDLLEFTSYLKSQQRRSKRLKLK